MALDQQEADYFEQFTGDTDPQFIRTMGWVEQAIADGRLSEWNLLTGDAWIILWIDPVRRIMRLGRPARMLDENQAVTRAYLPEDVVIVFGVSR